MPPLDHIIQQLPQQLIIGLTQGAIYALIALGYTMVYGVLRLINFAHGDIYMLGAYGGFFTALALGLIPIAGGHAHVAGVGEVALVFIAAMLACALAGMAIERLAYRPLRSSPRLAALITAIGVSMLLEYGGQAAFTPASRTFPALISSRPLIDRPTITFTIVQATIMVVVLLLIVALQFIVMKTASGAPCVPCRSIVPPRRSWASMPIGSSPSPSPWDRPWRRRVAS